MTLQEWVARSYRSYFIISSFMSFMFFFPQTGIQVNQYFENIEKGRKNVYFQPDRRSRESIAQCVCMRKTIRPIWSRLWCFFFLNSCVNGTEVIHVQFSQAEFRSSDYSENCNLKSALTTGGPSSSCEVIILRNNCHGEIIRVYIRNHFSNPFRGFPRT